jgi:hypothetical protein
MIVPYAPQQEHTCVILARNVDDVVDCGINRAVKAVVVGWGQTEKYQGVIG